MLIIDSQKLTSLAWGWKFQPASLERGSMWQPRIIGKPSSIGKMRDSEINKPDFFFPTNRSILAVLYLITAPGFTSRV